MHDSLMRISICSVTQLFCSPCPEMLIQTHLFVLTALNLTLLQKRSKMEQHLCDKVEGVLSFITQCFHVDRLIDFILLFFTIVQVPQLLFYSLYFENQEGKICKSEFSAPVNFEGGQNISIFFLDTVKLVKLVYLWSLSFVWSELLDMQF